MHTKSYWHLIAGLALIVLLTGCASSKPAPDAAAVPAGDEAASDPSGQLRTVTLGVGYVPNVQFAPYYVAQTKGFYVEEGLDVTLEYGFENDFVALTGQGKGQFAVASGDQVILSRAQGLPIVYVMKWYDRFPVGVMALAETGITTPKQLAGHSVGIPGLYGASYAGWEALVYASGLDASKVQLESIGFAQAQAVEQGQVDAAVIYIANEPVQLEREGRDVSVMEVSDYINLVSNGIVTNEALIEQDPDLVRRMVQASLRGLVYSIDHPDEAFSIARQAVPEITDETADAQRAVLQASLALWGRDGRSRAEDWQVTAEAMKATGLVDVVVPTGNIFSNEFVE